MAFLEFKNVRIAGISAGVPKKVINNLEMESPSQDYDSAAFVETTGVLERHVDDITTSDLCVPAAEKLLFDLGWDKSEVEAVLFVTQTPDYIEPATACIVQDRLGLSRECLAMDLSLGCSGWVYGLSTIASLMSGGGVKKALLMAGDARRRVFEDDALFGYAGTVTALEHISNAPGFQFQLGTDGSGYDAIIIPDGGARNQFSVHSLENDIIEGKPINRLQTRMKGMDVFSFGISTVPKSIKKLSEHFSFDYSKSDFFVFHQANMKMNALIAKKLKLDSSKVPSSLYHYGNTSSASIPLTMVAEMSNLLKSEDLDIICCGFGIGLSWGSVHIKTDKITVSNILEVEPHFSKEWI